MKLSAAIVIAAALIAGAMLTHAGWGQSTTTLLSTGIVVSACPSSGTSPAAGTMWTYTRRNPGTAHS